MIEELQAILGMIGDLSAIAGWVIGGFIVFKLVVYLSTAGIIYNLTKLFIERTHNWLTSPKPPALTDVYDRTKRLCIITDGSDRRLLTVLEKARMAPGLYHGGYLHSTHLDWLEEAIDAKIAEDEAKRSE